MGIKHTRKATEIDVGYVAGLARLKLSDEEIASFNVQLGQILEYVHKLGEVDVENVEPVAHVAEIFNVLRKDVDTEGDWHDRVMKNAPRTRAGQYMVPRIIE